MIYIRSEREIESLRHAGSIVAGAMERVRDMIVAGVTTRELSEGARVFIEGKGARAAFLGYQGFPGAICASVNEQVVHGIPGNRVLREGDLVKVDIGSYIDGFYGDMARTFPVGTVSDEARRLMQVTEESLYHGIAQARAGNRVGDIGNAVQGHVEPLGYGVTRALVGHGIGRSLWEEPQIPNYGKPGSGPRLKPGMVLAIEPMINAGTWEVATLDDDWTVVTKDGKLSAHFENTVVVREDHAEIITLMTGEEPWGKTTQ